MWGQYQRFSYLGDKFSHLEEKLSFSGSPDSWVSILGKFPDFGYYLSGQNGIPRLLWIEVTPPPLSPRVATFLDFHPH